jgi:hypothetical protein
VVFSERSLIRNRVPEGTARTCTGSHHDVRDHSGRHLVFYGANIFIDRDLSHSSSGAHRTSISASCTVTVTVCRSA